MAGIRKHVYLLISGIALAVYLSIPATNGLSCVVCDSQFNPLCNDSVYQPGTVAQDMEVWNNCTVCVAYTIYANDNTTIRGYVKDCEFEEDVIGCSGYTFNDSIVNVCVCDTDFCAKTNDSAQVMNDHVTLSTSVKGSTTVLDYGTTLKKFEYRDEDDQKDETAIGNAESSELMEDSALGFMEITDGVPTSTSSSTTRNTVTMKNSKDGEYDSTTMESPGYSKDSFAAIIIEYSTQSATQENNSGSNIRSLFSHAVYSVSICLLVSIVNSFLLAGS